jgi:hypothetical protein
MLGWKNLQGIYMFNSKKNSANGWFSYPPVEKQANGQKKE